MPLSRRETKSPVPQPSLPYPGESSQLFLEERFDARFLLPAIVAIWLGGYAAMDWARLLVRQWPSPWLFTIAFACATIFCVWRWRLIKSEIAQRRQGIRGERIVGQLLEDLRAIGCKVYHDICEDGFNIDHVIIGPHGVFSIETKTPSMPKEGGAVAFDGKGVTVAGYKPDRDPVVQARACARRLREILREMSGMEPAVTPVVLYVNWWVDMFFRDSDVIVMNHKYFFESFDRMQNRNPLNETQVNLLSASLERYLRAKS
jgi:hypothetical protein